MQPLARLLIYIYIRACAFTRRVEKKLIFESIQRAAAAAPAAAVVSAVEALSLWVYSRRGLSYYARGGCEWRERERGSGEK